MRRFTRTVASRRWFARGLSRLSREALLRVGAAGPVSSTPATMAAVRSLSTTSLCLAPKEAPYQCGECGKTFRLLNALNHHILTRHGNNAKALMKKDGKMVEMSAEQLKAGSHGIGGAAAAAAAAPAPGLNATPSVDPSSTPLTPAPSLSAPGAVVGSGASTAGSGFPGMFGAPFGAAPLTSPQINQATAAGVVGGSAAPLPTPHSAAVDTVADEDTEKRNFVCTICQKTFRLEAALQHHYQAKHNMDMPSTLGGGGAAAAAASSSALPGVMGDLGGLPGSAASFASATGATASGAGGLSAAEAAVAASSSTAGLASMSAAQYIRQQEGALPNAPQYHLDVAPNAPEEGDVAAHWRCVNLCVLMGSVQEVEEGYVFQDHVLQFTVATEFANPAPGDPDMDFHTVRVYGADFWQPLKADIQAGGRFLVTGRLRMVPQFDTLMKKYYHYPVIQVFPGTGNVVRA